MSATEIAATWEQGLKEYDQMRQAYLLRITTKREINLFIESDYHQLRQRLEAIQPESNAHGGKNERCATTSHPIQPARLSVPICL
jgi:hypothetical protein